MEFDPILAKNAGNYTCRALKLSPNSNWDEVATFIRVKSKIFKIKKAEYFTQIIAVNKALTGHHFFTFTF